MESQMENKESENSGLFQINQESSLNEECLRAVSKLVTSYKNKDEDDKSDNNMKKVTMEDYLINEFGNNHVIMGGTFSFEFPLGVPEELGQGRFRAHLLKRLLRSYTSTFETCHNFIFLAFNQLQRHSASREVFFKAKYSDKNMKNLIPF